MVEIVAREHAQARLRRTLGAMEGAFFGMFAIMHTTETNFASFAGVLFSLRWGQALQHVLFCQACYILRFGVEWQVLFGELRRDGTNVRQ